MIISHSKSFSHLLPDNFPELTSQQCLLTLLFAIEGGTYHKVDIYDRAIRFNRFSFSYDFGTLNNTSLKLALDGLLALGIVEHDMYYHVSAPYIQGLVADT